MAEQEYTKALFSAAFRKHLDGDCAGKRVNGSSNEALPGKHDAQIEMPLGMTIIKGDGAC